MVKIADVLFSLIYFSMVICQLIFVVFVEDRLVEFIIGLGSDVFWGFLVIVIGIFI